jgi:ABC-type branched-subunit amino acid transport system substrate-binding protein
MIKLGRCFLKLSLVLLLAEFLAGPLAAKDIEIGMSAAFKGYSRSLGIELYRGSLAYINHVNEHGGIRGRRLTLKVYEDGYDPLPTIQNTVKLITKDGVTLLFDYVGTPTVTRILPLLKKYEDKNVLLFFPFTGAQPMREPPYDKYIFNLRASYRQETRGLVDHLVRIGRKKIAVFHQSDAYGFSGLDGVRRALEAHGLNIAMTATYKRGSSFETSMKEQVAVLKESRPDAIISIGAYNSCAAFIRDARDSGWDIPIANISFVSSDRLLFRLNAFQKESGRDYTRNLLNSQVLPNHEDRSLPAVREYRKMMDKYNPQPPAEFLEKRLYEPQPYSFGSFEGFLNAKLLVHLLRNCDDTAHLRQCVERMHNIDLGIGSPISFGPARHQGLDQIYYTTFKDGRNISITDWKAWEKK